MTTGADDTETSFLSIEEAALLVADEGFVLGDEGLFASAILRCQTSIGGKDAYPTVFLKAAAMMESVARNHSILDGNKRASWLLTKIFLLANGRYLRADAIEGADHVEAVSQGFVTLDDSAGWLERHSSYTAPNA